MVGRRLTEQFPRVPHVIGESLMEVADLHGLRLPRGVSFIIHRGEIVGEGVPRGVPFGDIETRGHVFLLIPVGEE